MRSYRVLGCALYSVWEAFVVSVAICVCVCVCVCLCRCTIRLQINRQTVCGAVRCFVCFICGSFGLLVITISAVVLDLVFLLSRSGGVCSSSTRRVECKCGRARTAGDSESRCRC